MDHLLSKEKRTEEKRSRKEVIYSFERLRFLKEKKRVEEIRGAYSSAG